MGNLTTPLSSATQGVWCLTNRNSVGRRSLDIRLDKWLGVVDTVTVTAADLVAIHLQRIGKDFATP